MILIILLKIEVIKKTKNVRLKIQTGAFSFILLIISKLQVIHIKINNLQSYKNTLFCKKTPRKGCRKAKDLLISALLLNQTIIIKTLNSIL